MRADLTDGNMWLVTPDPALAPSGLRRPFYVKPEDFAKVLLEMEAGAANRVGASFPLRGMKVKELFTNFSVDIEQDFPAVDTTIVIQPSLGGDSRSKARWETAWQPWIVEEVEGNRPSYRVPVRLPPRNWVGRMTMTTWGQGFVLPRLNVFREGDATRQRVRWAGGNMGTGYDLCWGTFDVTKPLATLESYDSMFFQTAFNEDLQYDYKRWHSLPAEWGLHEGVERISSVALTTRYILT
jgi:hypothetical protein